MISPRLGYARQISFAWPQPQQPAGTATASFPIPSIPWVARFEANVDKLTTSNDLIFDGDSITDNMQSTICTESPNQTVWQHYNGSLNAADIGIGGDQVQHLIWRVQNGSLAGQNPKLIVLLIGTNNMGQAYTDVATGIQTLLNEYKTRCPRAHILLLGVFPRGSSNTDPARVWINSLNQILATYADGKRISYMDFGYKFLAPDGSIPYAMMGDGLHPSAAGYDIWFSSIQPILDQYVTNAATYTYSATVNGGTGSGNYPAGTAVTVTAAAAPAGSQFAGWTGDTAALANPSAASSTMTMLAQPMAITASYATTTTAPSIPTGLVATPGNTQVNLYWTASPGATTYNVYRGTTAGGESSTAIATGVTATSYTDTNLMSTGTTYYYKVAAVNSAGTSNTSNESSSWAIIYPSRQISFAWPQPTLPTGTPTAVFPLPRIDWVTNFEMNVDKLTSSYNLIFDGDSIASGFQNQAIWSTQYTGTAKPLDIGIYGDLVQNILWRERNGSLAGQTNAKLIVIEAGTNNYNETPSEVAAGIQLLVSDYKTLCPNAHILLHAIFPCSANPTDAIRVWVNQINQILSGTVYDSRVTYLDIGSQFLQSDGTLPTTMMADGVNPTAAGYAVWANAIQPIVNQYVVVPTTAPSIPTGLAATGGAKQVGLTWTCSTGATSFNIYRGTSAGGEGATAIATGVNTTSYVDLAVTIGTPYYYKIVAVNSVGTSGSSAEVTATPISALTVPLAPTNLTATASSMQATLSWIASSGASSYNIYRGTSANAEAATAVATVSAPATTYTDLLLTNGTTYYYKVAAVNNLGVSPSSNEVSATPSMGGVNLVSVQFPQYNGTQIWHNMNSGNMNLTGGVISVQNWNVANTGSGTSLANNASLVASDGSPLGSSILINAVGANTALTFTYSGYTNDSNSSTGIANFPTPLSGVKGGACDAFIALGSVFNQSATTPNILTVGGLDAGHSYNLIVYVTAPWWDNNGSKTATVKLANTTYYITTSNTLGAWTQATSTTAGSPSVGNYVLFSNLTGATSQVVTITGIDVGSAGFQILDLGPTVVTYPLTVNSGTGSGNYQAGAVVQVTANPAQSGYQFLNWSGATSALANPSAASTTVTMPAAATTITANYSFSPTFALTVHNGSGSGDYSQGALVTISANTAPTGYQFAGWTGSISALSNPAAATTTFNMPAAVVEVTASYALAPSYSLWSSQKFTTQQLADQTISGPTAIPLKDGISNLLKYLFDINPTAPMTASDRNALPVVGMTTISGSSYLTLTYRQNATQAGLTISVQTSTDLNTWTTVTPDNTVNVGTDSATGDPLIQVQVKVNPTGAPKEFIRLNVTSS